MRARPSRTYGIRRKADRQASTAASPPAPVAAATHRAAVVAAEGGQLGEPVVNRVVGGLDAEDQHALPVVRAPDRAASPGSSSRQLAGWRPAWAIARTASSATGDVREGTRRGRLVTGPVLQPHPGLGDDAEGAFGAEEEAVRGRAGAGGGQPPRLGDPGRGHHPHGLDEVVDVRVQRGVVAAGAGGQPAAEGGELEALREVAQGQAVPRRRSCSSSAGPRAPAWMRAARLVVSSSSTRSRPTGPATDAGVVTSAVLDAADDGAAAAVRDHGDRVGARPVEQVHHLGLVVAGRRRGRGRP